MYPSMKSKYKKKKELILSKFVLSCTSQQIKLDLFI